MVRCDDQSSGSTYTLESRPTMFRWALRLREEARPRFTTVDRNVNLRPRSVEIRSRLTLTETWGAPAAACAQDAKANMAKSATRNDRRMRPRLIRRHRLAVA